jgi:hypothetical protein
MGPGRSSARNAAKLSLVGSTKLMRASLGTA